MEKSSTSRTGRVVARWGFVFALGVLAGGLLTQLKFDSSASAQPTGSASIADKGLMIVAGQLNRDSYGLYLVDSENSTICVYQWVPDSRELQLLSARTFLFDRQLDEYNTKPSPKAIKEMVEKARRLGSSTTRP